VIPQKTKQSYLQNHHVSEFYFVQIYELSILKKMYPSKYTVSLLYKWRDFFVLSIKLPELLLNVPTDSTTLGYNS